MTSGVTGSMGGRGDGTRDCAPSGARDNRRASAGPADRFRQDFGGSEATPAGPGADLGAAASWP
jgi:hypothetical protein